MNDFVLSCCSTADLSKEHFEDRNIHYICFHFYLDGKEYSDDLGQSISFDDFYRAMINGAETKTSQVNTEEFVEYFTPFLEAGKDVLHVSLSSGISGVYNAASGTAIVVKTSSAAFMLAFALALRFSPTHSIADASAEAKRNAISFTGERRSCIMLVLIAIVFPLILTQGCARKRAPLHELCRISHISIRFYYAGLPHSSQMRVVTVCPLAASYSTSQKNGPR